MQFLLANYAEIVESIQARRIRVKLSITYQRPKGKKSRKCKEIKAAIWQAAKFSQVAKLQPADTVPASSALFHIQPLFSYSYTLLLFCYSFCFFSYFNPCNSFCFGLFCNLPYTEHLYKSQSVQTLNQSTSINKVTGEASCSPTWLLLSSASLSFVFFSIFSATKHSLMMTN